MPKISDLTAATALDADDVLYVVEDGNSRKATIPQIMEVSALGWGQSWQDVTASRAVATSYQNTTGKPIMVAIEPNSATPGNLEVSSDGSTWVRIGVIIASGSDVRGASAIVPPDHYYRQTAGGFFGWKELR